MAAVAGEIFAKDARRHEERTAHADLTREKSRVRLCACEQAATAAAEVSRFRIRPADSECGACMRVTWVQPEDLVGHELRQAREEGKDVDAIEARWLAAGGAPAPARGASPGAASRPSSVALALELLDELDALPRPLADRRAGRLRRDPRRG